MQRLDLAICSFYDVSPELVMIVDQKLIVGLEKWRGLILAGNGLSGLSPTGIPLVDNRRKRFIYLSIVPADQTHLGLNNPAQRLFWIAHRMMSCSFYHHRGISIK